VFGIGAGVIYNAKFYAALDNTVIVPGYTRDDGGLFFKVNEKNFWSSQYRESVR
jgi:catecholate siderophore receptor